MNEQLIHFDLKGKTKELLDKVIENWIIPLPKNNPAILEMFRDRNRIPYRNILPWSGEFAGKFLTGACLVYKLTENAHLKECIHNFAAELISFQNDDGYIGPRPDGYYLTGDSPNTHLRFDGNSAKHTTWDAWEFYHVMIGLLMWFEISRDSDVLSAVCKMGDLLCRRFSDKTLISLGDPYANFAPIHSLCKLYKHTHKEDYLILAEKITAEFSLEGGGNYLNNALLNIEFYESDQPRWESLHTIEALAELYEITGKEHYLLAFKQIWASIAKTDVHNTGGFSSDEKAGGDPFKSGAIETCCTVAWMALSCDMLRLTHDAAVADMLERSMYNAAWGSMNPNGRWFTYNTPMEGYRFPAFTDIGWQARPGSPELSCCAASGAKVMGILAQWAVTQNENEVYINYYGEGSATIALPNGNVLSVEQTTTYPESGKIIIKVKSSSTDKTNINLRIPSWSKKTSLSINDEVCYPSAGYYNFSLRGQSEATVTLMLDMSVYTMIGEQDKQGYCSFYRGPILLTVDESINSFALDEYVPSFSELPKITRIEQNDRWMLYECIDDNGKRTVFCDFASAGYDMGMYTTWVRSNLKGSLYSKNNPLRISN